MQVRFLGGRRVKNLTLADGTKVPVGGETDLPPRTVSVLRARGYRFESIGDEPLPPAQQEAPPQASVPPNRRQTAADARQAAIDRAQAQEQDTNDAAVDAATDAEQTENE